MILCKFDLYSYTSFYYVVCIFSDVFICLHVANIYLWLYVYIIMHAGNKNQGLRFMWWLWGAMNSWNHMLSESAFGGKPLYKF